MRLSVYIAPPYPSAMRTCVLCAKDFLFRGLMFQSANYFHARVCVYVRSDIKRIPLARYNAIPRLELVHSVGIVWFYGQSFILRDETFAQLLTPQNLTYR